MNLDVLYQPRGKAGEYAELAVNLFEGCSNGCRYCYAPQVLKRDREAFHKTVQPRKNILERFDKDCKKLGSHYGVLRECPPPILMCFTCDPYPPEEREEQITGRAIPIAHEHGFGVHILTKNGTLAKEDFDILGKDDAYATTLTTVSDNASRYWEPNADLPGDRIYALRIAKEVFDLHTWVSLEPVVSPKDTLELIRQTHKFVDLYKVGKLNYLAEAKEIDWREFARRATELLDELGAKYIIKKDLQEYL